MIAELTGSCQLSISDDCALYVLSCGIEPENLRVMVVCPKPAALSGLETGGDPPSETP